nr:MAG TPA: hypothetical protein [Bacteriophage sp.]
MVEHSGTSLLLLLLAIRYHKNLRYAIDERKIIAQRY